jgi:DNA-binding MarR family transcriptional regulator
MLENDARGKQEGPDFAVTETGRLRETAVREMVLRLKEHFAQIDELSLEAHLMLELTHGLLANMRAAQWSGSGMAGRRFPLLRLLYLADGNRLKMGTIAANLGIGTNNTTQLVDGMVRDGLVRREPDEDDKRVIYAVLTPHGAALFADFFPRNAGRVHDAWSPLSDEEKDLFVNLLAKVRLNLLTTIGDAAEARQVDSEPAASDEKARRLPSISKMSQPKE